MYSEKSQEYIDYTKKWANDIVKTSKKMAKIYDKLSKTDILGGDLDIDLCGIDILRDLAGTESLLFISNQILENIEDVVKLKNVNMYDGIDYKVYGFKCLTEDNVQINIKIDFEESKTCKLEYEDVTTKKAILKCE